MENITKLTVEKDIQETVTAAAVNLPMITNSLNCGCTNFKNIENTQLRHIPLVL